MSDTAVKLQSEDDVRRLVESVPCRRCGLPRSAGAHMAREAPSCTYRLSRDLLVATIWRALQ